MDRTTPLLTLALLALGTPALASDIDEVSTFDLSSSVVAEKGDGEQLQHRSRNTRASNKGGAAHANGARGQAPAAQRSSAARPQAAASTARYGGRPAPRPTAAAAATAHGRPPVVTHTRPGPPPASGGPRPSTGPSRPGTYNNHGTVVSRPPTGHRPPTAYATPRPNGATVVHRPGPVVVHRPGPTVVHRPGVVVHHPVVVRPAVRVHTVRYTHVRPYHGIFVYGPRPVTHVQYVQGGPGPVEVERADLPKRAIDRENSIGIGLKGGSMLSSTSTGDVYGDPGLALVGRYRPAESVGLELAVGHHGSGYVDPVGSRSQTQVAPSVELFAFPWTRVSPYALGGVTWNSANVSDEVWNGNGYDLATNTDSQWGLHAGLGLELALGNNFALDFEGRYIGWLDERLEGEAPGAIQATAGLQVYFK